MSKSVTVADTAWAFARPDGLQVFKQTKGPPRPDLNGGLYCTIWGNSTVYLIDQGHRRAFPSAECFKKLYGTEPTEALVSVDSSIFNIPVHPTSSVIPEEVALISGGGAGYLVDRWDGGRIVKRCFPSWEMVELYRIGMPFEPVPIGAVLGLDDGPAIEGRA